jgi:hypothetical protein
MFNAQQAKLENIKKGRLPYMFINGRKKRGNIPRTKI